MAFALQSLRQTSEQQRSLTRAGGDNLMPLINMVTRPTPVIFPRWFSNIPLALSVLHGAENSHSVFWVVVAYPFVICGFRPAYGTSFSASTSVFPFNTIPPEVHTHIRLLPTVYSLGHDCSKMCVVRAASENLVCTRETWTSIHRMKEYV